MAETQRPLSVSTPLPEGDKAFILELFRGYEAISEPFQFQLLLLTDPDTKTFDFDKLLGQAVTVTMLLPDGTSRYFHGMVNRLTQGGQVRWESGKKATIRYLAEIVPQFWFWKRTAQTRVFQKMTVIDILKKVMTGITKTKWDVQDPEGGWKAREYTVQFRESDYNFACRLMEDEGLFYYFTHAKDGHTMVVSNKSSAWTDVPIKSKITFDDTQGGQYEDDVISEWQKIQEVRSGKLTLWDAHCELTGKNLEATQTITPSVSIGTATHKIKLGVNDKFELYDFPGGYAWRFDGIDAGGADQASKLQDVFKDNVRVVGIRTDREAVAGIIIEGHSTCRQLTAGCKFTLDKHFDSNDTYVLTKVEHAAAQLGAGATSQSGGLGGKLQYENRFRCIPTALPFRPPIVTPRPRVEGVQNAVVVGPSGQEIFPDKYGRVKVQFLWDREGKKDTTTSCWLRVATLWAGKQFGFIRVPRIGEEVLVDFLDGDPDRPVIVGCVYNDAMMPPYADLPDTKTVSGLKTWSSPETKGDVTKFNELRFNDSKDNEEIYFHAQKDFVRIVENSDTLRVGYKGDVYYDAAGVKNGKGLADDKDKPDVGCQAIKIFKDRTTTIDTGNETLIVNKKDRYVSIKEGNDKHEVVKGQRDHIVEKDDTTTINSGNRAVTISKGNDTLTVKMGDRTTEIKGNDTLTLKMGNETININMGNFAMTVKLGNIDIKANVGKITLDALGGITLKSGPTVMKLDPSGIDMKGMMFKAKGDLTAQVEGGLMNTVKSGLMTTVKGTIVMIN